MKKIAILGMTGSIGRSALEVVKRHPDQFQITLASSHNSQQDLIDIAREMNIPRIVITGNPIISPDLPPGIELFQGQQELLDLMRELDLDLLLNAVSGSAGLPFSIATLDIGIDLALANKESLVMAGHLIRKYQKSGKVNLIPVDSEHSAIKQAMGKTPVSQIRNLILTASGGPFHRLPLSEFNRITPEDTLKHPTWEMGKKITVDSATMINKGLEIIEARWLFEMDINKIKTVIHPQSVIHSFVEMIDGSIIAQMSTPDMQLPILYAFTYPERIESDLCLTSLTDLPSLSFHEIEKERYPLFYLTVDVGKAGGLLPTVLNAVNEAAVTLFLEKKIDYLGIARIISRVIESSANSPDPDLETILAVNREVHAKTMRDYKSLK